MLYVIILLLFSLFSIWFFYPYFVSFILGGKINIIPPVSDNLANLGLYGDTYGGLNAIFSGLAMIAAFTAVWYNSKDRKKKQFEDHFFQQMDTIQYITSSIKIYKSIIKYKLNISEEKYLVKEITVERDLSGMEFFIFLRNNFIVEKIESHPQKNVGKYQDFYDEYLHRVLGHYFRAIYQVIKYTDRYQHLKAEDKIFYIHLLRAQISSDELYFMFYNGLSKYGKGNLKPLLEKYAFFEHLQNEITSSDLIKYNISAYGDNEQLCEEYNKQKINRNQS